MNKEQKTNGKRERTSTFPSDEGSLFEKVVPEGIKRGLEGLLRDGRLKNIVGDLKLPKEIIAHILAQVDETKHAALEVIAREIRASLEKTDFADEIARILTKITLEVRTQIRFVNNGDKIETEITHSRVRAISEDDQERGEIGATDQSVSD